MKGFVVHVNGERLCTAGVEKGVLTALITLAGRPESGQFSFHIGGIDGASNERIEWPAPKIGVGDTITIRVVETAWVEPEPQR